MLELLCILFWELAPGLLGGALLGRKSLLGFSVRADLFLEVFLLHLKQLLGLLQPLFVLLTLRVIWGEKGALTALAFPIFPNREAPQTQFMRHCAFTGSGGRHFASAVLNIRP